LVEYVHNGSTTTADSFGLIARDPAGNESDSFTFDVAVTLAGDELLGDVNLDGAVNFSDIPAFISALRDGEYLAEADVNEDGLVDFSDIPLFIDLLRDQ